MKILYLHPRSWSGEYAMLRELGRRGETVCVLEEKRGLAGGARVMADHFETPGDGIGTLWYDPRRGAARLLTWPFDRFFRRAFDGRRLVYRMWVIRAALARFRPDVVVCSDGFSYAIPAALLKRLGLMRERLVVTYIGGDILDCPQADVGKRRTPTVSWLIRTSLNGIDALRPVSPLLERVLWNEGAERGRVSVLPSHLIEPRERLAEFRTRKRALAGAIRARYGIPAAAPLLVTLSGNQKGKGLHLLAQVWTAICDAIPGCRWLLCGPEDPWLETGVRPVLRASPAGAQVHFTGRLDGAAVFEHLAAADLHVNPTLCEGLNMVTVEAAAVATPTLTTDGAGIADWVERLGAGRVVPAGDAAALERAVIESLTDTPLLLRWQDSCPAMLADFSLDHVADRLLHVMRPSQQ